tara:strand:- start:18799 stop:19200 length:402 start_codon:yes stop_codon:yes gene_type:complete
MDISDDFYATIKIKYTGEEIFCKVAASEEEGRTMLLLSNPYLVDEVKLRGQTAGYKFEPWLKTSSEDLHLINMDDVLTISESNNIEMILCYNDCIRKNSKTNYSKLDRKMGYISSVTEAKEILEKLYKLNINS